MMRYRRLSYGYALLVGSAQPDSAVRLAPTTWCPSADVYETRDEIHVTVELAGVELDEIDLLVFDDALIVEGRRRLRSVSERGQFHMARIRQGPFRLELALPARIDLEQVTGRTDAGLLQITLRKARAS